MIKMIQEILLSAVFTIGFTTVAFGLSNEEVTQCKSYMEKYGSGQSQIVSADATKEASDMLAICSKGNICQNELLTMDGCQKKLLSWEANPPTAEKKSTTQQKKNAVSNKQKPAAPSTPPSATTKKTEQPVPADLSNSDIQTTNTPQPKKNKTPSINWF